MNAPRAGSQLKIITVMVDVMHMPDTPEIRATAGIVSNLCAQRVSRGHPGYDSNGLAAWREQDIDELVSIIDSIQSNGSAERQRRLTRNEKHCACGLVHAGEC